LKPELTVCIPTYNRAGFLRECLTCLLDQGLPREDYLVLISDNASTDETPEVVRTFAEKLQIEYHRNEETVVAVENLSAAAERVRTPYVSFLCDDDLLVPGQLGRALTALRAHPRACLYASLGLAQHSWGDPRASVLGALIDPEPVEGDPFLLRWDQRCWLAACSLHTPMTIIGSVFHLPRITTRPLIDTAFPQEGDRLLFLEMAGAGEILSAPWIGGHLRFHAGQQSHRNRNQRAESRRVTELVLARAAELGHDLPAFWIERLRQASETELEFFGDKIARQYPRELSRRILSEAGARRRWKALRHERKRQARNLRPQRGPIGKLKRLLGG
jgi:hypothetical protein